MSVFADVSLSTGNDAGSAVGREALPTSGISLGAVEAGQVDELAAQLFNGDEANSPLVAYSARAFTGGVQTIRSSLAATPFDYVSGKLMDLLRRQKPEQTFSGDYVHGQREQFERVCRAERAHPIGLDTEGALCLAIDVSQVGGGGLRDADSVRSALQRLQGLSMVNDAEIPIKLILLSGSEMAELTKPKPQAMAASVGTGVRRLDKGLETEPALTRILSEARSSGASDVHIQPRQGGTLIRFRLDGVLHDTYFIDADPTGSTERDLGVRLVNRIKVIGNLKPDERRVPQDGSIGFDDSGALKNLSVRIVSLPQMIRIGESREGIVFRLFDNTPQKARPLSETGLLPAQLRMLQDMLEEPRGLILVSGPTGSGKTTLLYAAIEAIPSDNSIVTAENPVERIVPRASQFEVNPAIGNTFPKLLEHMLRADPDVMVIGEIRDAAVAATAAHAATTGHLVLATTHANGVVATPGRLLDMEVAPGNLQAISGIVAIRLVRLLCKECSVSYDASDELNSLLKDDSKKAKTDSPEKPVAKPFFQPNSVILKRPPYITAEGSHGDPQCSCCKGKGYAGRTAIAELMRIDEEGRTLLRRDPRNEAALAELALSQGLMPMVVAGFLKAREGVTSVEDIRRACLKEEFVKHAAAIADVLRDSSTPAVH